MATPAQPSRAYSKEEHLAMLKGGKEGIEAWNKWTAPILVEDRGVIDLTGADLKNCDLTHVDLRGINLEDAIFEKAELYGADLGDANLQGANLTDVQAGLLPWQLAGSDLTGAKLPEPLEKLFEKMGAVSDISDSAKKLFLALLAACLYSWLTIATTKDVALITDRASSPLPIIQTAIPIIAFYVVAPIILLCVYFYFHFYLQKLWEELAQLPAIFPDGKRLYERADPWLFNDLVRAHVPRLKKDRPLLSYFQQWISILLAWWVVPVTLLLFWGRYLPRHDVVWTLVLAILLAISIVSAIQLYRLASETLRTGLRKSFEWNKMLKARRTHTDLLRAIAVAAVTIAISLGAIFGAPRGAANSYRSPRTWIPGLMKLIGYSPFANLQDADVSIKPPNWTGKNEQELDQVKGADLSAQDLLYAKMRGSFLAKSKIRSTHLEEADLSYADLRAADLTQIYLTGVNLLRADLSQAYLELADLSGAYLALADLRNTKKLTPDQIKASQTEGWKTAFFDDDMLKQLGLPPDHNTILQAYKESGSGEPFDSWQQKWRADQAKAAANQKSK